MAFPQDELCPKVFVKLGDDWVDLSERVRGQIGIRYGGQGEGPALPPGRAGFELANTDGYLTPDNPTSPYWPYVDIAAPARIELPPGMVPTGLEGQFYGEVSSWVPYWVDGVEDEARVAVEAAGILERLTQAATPLESAMRRHYLSQPHLVSYVPLEDGDDTRVAASLAAGASGVPYNWGAAPDYPLRPGWGGDNSLPGSAPLPGWPVVGYFGWSGGGTVRIPGPTGPWAVQVNAKVPPGSGEAWLTEWRTSGGRYTSWALKVNSSGQLLLTGSDDADTPSTFTHTATTLGSVADDVWRTITVVVIQSGSSQSVRITVGGGVVQQFSTTATTVGRLARIRPRPMFASVTDKAPIGLGHTAAFAEVAPSGTITRFFNELLGGFHAPPLSGWQGERAAGRVVRLGDEEGVGVELIRGAQIVDSPGLGTVPLTSGQATALTFARSGPESEILVRASASVSGGGFGVVVRSSAGDPFQTTYMAYTVAGIAGANLFIDVLIGGSSVGGVDGEWPGGVVDPGTTYWVRVQAVGYVIRMQVWEDGSPPPGEAEWHLTMVDTRIAAGRAGALALAAFGTPTITLDLAQVWDLTSVPVGVQQRATLVGNCTQAAEVDQGIFGESRTSAGLFYRPSSALYNLDASMELSCKGATEGEPGQIGADFAPAKDTRSVANDVTVSRIGGGSARAVQDTGPRSVQQPPNGVGHFPAGVTLNAASDAQLPDLAGWLLHFGVDAGMRLPALPIDLAWSPELIPTWVALRPGDRIDLTDLPRQMQAPLRIRFDGWSAVMDATDWQLQITASPYVPWVVGRRLGVGDTPGPADPVRRGTGGTVVVSDFQVGVDAALVVTTTQGPRWASTGASNLHLPLDIRVRGVRLRVTAISAPTGQQQTMTVEAEPVNGVVPFGGVIPAGEAVSLWQPTVRAL